MTQLSAQQGPVVPVKPQANIYTLLLIVSILVLTVTIGIVLWKLMSSVDNGGYGLQFSNLFQPFDVPKTVPK